MAAVAVGARLARWLGFSPVPAFPAVHVTAAPLIEVVLEGIRGQSTERLWREQPHLRTLVGFIARNIAQLGLHAYSIDPDGGRTRQRDTPLARLLVKPNAQTTGYELVCSLISDLCLHDIAYVFLSRDADSESGWVLRNIPAKWVAGTYGATAFSYAGYEIAFPESATGERVKVPAANMLVFHGWNPADPRFGASPVEALKTILAEQIHSQIYRDQNWQRGGRVGSVLSRPAEAPKWSPEAREKFRKEWKSKYQGNNGSEAGGTPILEDGMKLERVGFSAREDQYIEANKLSLSTVAQVYFVNPTMVGLLDNANYSNVREFRRMLYGDTLGPLIEMIQQRLNAFLVPQVSGGDPDAYVEFNVKSKLQASFEEQAAVLQSSIGGPWMTINEGRAKENLPAIEGGDELIKPLNVTQNGDQQPIPAAGDDENEDPAGDPDNEDQEDAQ